MTKPHLFEKKKEEMKAIQKFKKKIMKGLLEVFFLVAVSEKPRYGYGIRKTIEKKFGVDIGRITCYTKMYLLEKEGYLESRREGFFPTRPKRRYYSLTDKGKHLLEVLLDYLDKLEFVYVKVEEETDNDRQIIHPTS